jgi:hypothetical protein
MPLLPDVYLCACTRRGARDLHRNHISWWARFMNIFPANEHLIWEVERGRSASAILPLSEGKSLAAGDSILFALSISHGHQPPCYVKGGDSVRVTLTGVTDLEKTDPATGESLVQIAWEPLGQDGSSYTTSRRGARSL